MLHLNHNVYFTLNEYNALNNNTRSLYPFYCPNEYPYFCGKDSNSFGLCKKRLEDCNNVNIDGVIPILACHTDYGNKGAKYGYYTDNLHMRCKNIILNKEKTFYTSDIQLPLMFSIMTYNIWGLPPKNDFILKLMKIRINLIADIIIKNNPDIICFQEVSLIPLRILKKRLSFLYKYQYETDYFFDEISQRNREVETITFSKYPVCNYQVYGLDGNLRYNNSLIRTEFNNCVVYNVYLQAGSKKSPGQEYYWFHYTRCRIDQLKRIKELIEKDTKPVIICGDFNFHLDGGDEWLEYNEIKDYFKDSWKELNKKDGFTENTDINTMRWNLKFQEKKVRYDGILYRATTSCTASPQADSRACLIKTGCTIRPFFSKIVGKQSVPLNKEMTKLFIKNYISDEHKKIKYNNKKTINIFPSDHFGVITKFKMI
jgi:exonuclease III